MQKAARPESATSPYRYFPRSTPSTSEKSRRSRLPLMSMTLLAPGPAEDSRGGPLEDGEQGLARHRVRRESSRRRIDVPMADRADRGEREAGHLLLSLALCVSLAAVSCDHEARDANRGQVSSDGWARLNEDGVLVDISPAAL